MPGSKYTDARTGFTKASRLVVSDAVYIRGVKVPTNKLRDLSVNQASVRNIKTSTPDLVTIGQSAPNPQGAYNGPGGGDKAVMGAETDSIHLSNFKTAAVHSVVQNGPLVLTVPYMNVCVALDGKNQGQLLSLLGYPNTNPRTGVVTKQNSTYVSRWDKTQHFVNCPDDGHLIRAGVPFVGPTPPAIWVSRFYKTADIVSKFPDATIKNIPGFKPLGMAKNTDLAPFMLSVGDSNNIAGRSVKITEWAVNSVDLLE